MAASRGKTDAESATAAVLELFDGSDGARSAGGAEAPPDVPPREPDAPPAGAVAESAAGYSSPTLPRLGWSGHVFALEPDAAREIRDTASPSAPSDVAPPERAEQAPIVSDMPASAFASSDNGRPATATHEHREVSNPAPAPARDPIVTRAVARAREKREEAERVSSRRAEPRKTQVRASRTEPTAGAIPDADARAFPGPRKAEMAPLASDGRDAGEEPGFDLDARYEEAKRLAEAGDYGPAIDAYHEVLRRDPSNVRARNNLGFAYDARGDHDLAITEYLQALELDPRNVQVLCNLGGVYGTKGWYPKAEEALKGALRVDPKSAEAHCNLGIVYCKKGLYHLATAELKRAIELDAGFVQTFYYLGECYNHLDRVDDAIEAFERSLQAQPSNHRAYYNLGILFDKKNMPDRAMRMYRRARDLQGPARGV